MLASCLSEMTFSIQSLMVSFIKNLEGRKPLMNHEDTPTSPAKALDTRLLIPPIAPIPLVFLLVSSQLSVMSRYPYRHSTYFTRSDALETSSELPPMNSREDILQDLFMNDPSKFHYKEVTPVQKLESVGRKLKKGFRTSMIAFGHSFRRRRTDSTTRLL